jgi:flagellar basal-body rod modification protein FlgD
LLVTEMQNQDPTADTDPNEYINQLVNVNSLEQLIDINQNLSTALGTSSTSTGGTATAQSASASSALTAAGPAGAAAQAGSTVPKGAASIAAQTRTSGAGNLAALSSAAKTAPGNLSVPKANPSATSVARGLDGHSHAQSTVAGVPIAR